MWKDIKEVNSGDVAKLLHPYRQSIHNVLQITSTHVERYTELILSLFRICEIGKRQLTFHFIKKCLQEKSTPWV